MTDISTVIEGSVKFRDGKKWKSRWCVMRKLSPVADCLHLQLYRDSKDRYKQSQTKASLSLQNFLGVHSGFTLDKESNTLAILCQDVSVVLAFDTRERLIQWQVKIANNLGEDEQFLVQISSAPAKAKVSPGPARLHVQEFRFCLTVGVPPRLVGHWQIQQLRKYGSVEKKFCFEGGSSSGKGEGLYVLVTDQGENIARAFQMAAEGRLTVRRRPLARNMSVMTSPRRSIHSRMDPRVSDLSCVNSVCPRSAESDVGDTRSQLGWSAADLHCHVSEDRDTRSCSSRVTRLLSRSSTLTATPHQTADYYDGCFKSGTLSMASNYDRSTVSSLEYWSSQSSSVGGRVRSWSAVPGRPQPLRAHNSLSTNSMCGCRQNPYSNYDVPKPLTGRSSAEPPKENVVDCKQANYDTPRCLRDSSNPLPSSQVTRESLHCHNQPHQQVQSRCLVVEREEPRPLKCPCQRVMCWAGSWIRLPHLFTGAFRNSITDTTRTIHKVKLDGEGKMPFVNCGRESHISSRSRKPSLSEVFDEEQELCRNRTEIQEAGIQYANVKVIFNNCTEKTDSVIQEEPKSINSYVNLEFSNSLKLYENSRDLLICNVSPKISDLKENQPEVSESQSAKCCEKCSCKITVAKSLPRNDDYLFMEPGLTCSIQSFQRKSALPIQQSPVHEKFSQGYLPMIPVSSRLASTNDSKPNVLNQKSQSTPTLPIDHQQVSEPSKQKNGIIYQSISENSSPFLRYRVRVSEAHVNQEILASRRKRSSSMGSSKYLSDCLEKIEDEVVASPTLSNANSTDSVYNLSEDPKQIVNSSSEQIFSRTKQECETKSEFESANNDTIDQNYNVRSFDPEGFQHSSGKIKRSASIPCKYVYNRDSSSSNDSGVSSSSLKFRRKGVEFDFLSSLKLQKLQKTKREYFNKRKSKSFDILEDNSFSQVNKAKSSSAEAIVHACSSKEYSGLPKVVYLDSQSSSSGTSDMSDYIETLSLYSYTSSDTPDSFQLHQSNHTKPS